MQKSTLLKLVFLIAVFISFSVQNTEAFSQEKRDTSFQSSFTFGLHGALPFLLTDANYSGYNSVPTCCPTVFGSKSGLSLFPAIGLSIEYQLLDFLSLQLKPNILQFGSKLIAEETVLVNNNGTPVPVIIDHSMDNDLLGFGLDFSLILKPLSQLRIGLGASVHSLISSSFVQEERIRDKANFEFLGANLPDVRNRQEGTIPNVNKLPLFVTGSIGYLIPLTNEFQLVPEATFNYSLSSFANDLVIQNKNFQTNSNGSFKVNALRLGVALLYNPSITEEIISPEIEKEKIDSTLFVKENIEKQKIENEKRLEKERLALLESKKIEQENIEKENLSKLEKENTEKEKLLKNENEKERLAREKLEKENLAKSEEDRLKAEKVEKERLAKEGKDRLAREKLESENLAKAEKDRIDREKLLISENEKDRLVREKLERENLAKADKSEKERLALEEKDRLAREKLERENLVKADKAEKERLALEEKDRLVREKLERENLAKADKSEKERLALEEKDRLAREKLERENLAKADKSEKDRLALEEKNRLAQEKLQRENLAKADKSEKERLALEEKDRLAREKIERENLAKADKAEKDRLALEEKERLASEKLERENLAKADKAEKDRLALEEKERLAREKLARENLGKAEAEQLVLKNDKERKQAEEQKIALEKKKIQERAIAEEERKKLELAVLELERIKDEEVKANEKLRAEKEAKQEDIITSPECLISTTRPVLLVEGIAKKYNPEKPIAAKSAIVFENIITNNSICLVATIKGKFTVPVVDASTHYGFYAKKNGYYSTSQNIPIETVVSQEQKLPPPPVTLFKITDMESNLLNEPVVLNNVFFKFNKPELSKKAHPELDRLAELLLTNEKVRVEIHGFISKVEYDREFNTGKRKLLSSGRAKAVLDYLKSKGVKRSSMRVADEATISIEPNPLSIDSKESAEQAMCINVLFFGK